MGRKKKPLDKKGYYRILKVATDAPQEELGLAFAMARSTAAPGPALRRLEEAYETLKDPRKRAAYDKEDSRNFEPLKSPVTLVVSVVLLIALFVWFWLPEIQKRSKSFRSGQTLVEMRTGRVFGEVVRYERNHSFPGGVTGAAYLVKVGTGGPERWFPAIDLQATCTGQ
jgi:hypothetical protein